MIDLPFIVQIILTVIAWVRGWQWKALLPLVTGFASGLVVPIFVSPESAAFAAVALIINLAIIAVLGYMVAKPPKIKKTK